MWLINDLSEVLQATNLKHVSDIELHTNLVKQTLYSRNFKVEMYLEVKMISLYRDARTLETMYFAKIPVQNEEESKKATQEIKNRFLKLLTYISTNTKTTILLSDFFTREEN